MSTNQAPSSISDFYWPLEDAIKELQERRKGELMNKTEKSLATKPVLSVLLEDPRLIIFRQLATPSNEVTKILNDAKNNNIGVLFIEYLEDKFTPSLNRYKQNLAKLPIYNGADINKNDIIVKINIVDFPRMEGRPLSSVLSHKKEFLCDLHHFLLKTSLGVSDNQIVDCSDFFLKFSSPLDYYKEFFKYFICHNILAEVYLKSGAELNFTKNIISPAIEAINNEFGVKPLIWNYLNNEFEDESFWDSYPKQVGDLLKEKGYHK